MRGVIEGFDSAAGTGTIRSYNGKLYSFARTAPIRRSKEPHAQARVVFRLKDGKVFRAPIGPDQHERNWHWEMTFWPLEWLLYVP